MTARLTVFSSVLLIFEISKASMSGTGKLNIWPPFQFNSYLAKLSENSCVKMNYQVVSANNIFPVYKNMDF